MAGWLSLASADAQFQPPKLAAKPAGYIVIDSINPRTGRLALALDANGDGSLSRVEIAKAPVALGQLDRNGDGRIEPSPVFRVSGPCTTVDSNSSLSL